MSLSPIAIAEPGNSWIQVEGGSWVPDTQTISTMKEKIEPFVRAQTKTAGRQLRAWNTYTFQYQGQEDRGKRLVFVNAFCINDSQWQLKKRMLTVSDGGTCFFNLKYDPENNIFFGLLINGEA
jgi:hypothetical protein